MAITQRNPNRLTAELAQPRHWFYLSFANDSEFLGGVIVEAHGVVTATQRADQLGISPPDYLRKKATVLSWKLEGENLRKVPLDLRNKLISEQELMERLDGKGAAE
jgi:hypothetical protein